MTIQVAETHISSLLYGTDLYRVPLYQRDFSWTLEEITQFWDDVLRSMNEPQPYFFGSIILVGTENQTLLEVLDGQQRLAAFSLLLAAARDSYDGDSPYRSSLIEGLERLDIAGAFGPGRTHRLHLNRRDDPYFRLIALGQSPTPPSKPSHKLIRRAYEYFKENVDEEIASRGPDHFSDDLMTALTNRLRLIRIFMTDMANAQMVFEAVNSAGLDLSQADLIKNHLLRSAPQNEAEPLYHTWDTVASRIEEGRGQVTDFVRTSVNSRYEFVRKNDLYKDVRALVGIRTEQLSPSMFLSRLSDDAVFWTQLRTGSLTSLPHHLRDKAGRDLADLWAFNIKLAEVPLLGLRSAVESNPQGFVAAIRWFRDFFVRYAVVGGRASNVIETDFSEWAIRIRSGRMELGELHTRLTELSPNNEEFRESFKAFTPKVQRVARTILARINDESGGHNVITETLASGGYVQLEHVVPQSPEHWGDVIAQIEAAGFAYEEVLNSIGNLTLLPPTINLEITNLPFMQKRWAYEGREGPDDPSPPHPAPINSLLAGLTGFGAQEFEERREWLAERALEVWTLA